MTVGRLSREMSADELMDWIIYLDRIAPEIKAKKKGK